MAENNMAENNMAESNMAENNMAESSMASMRSPSGRFRRRSLEGTLVGEPGWKQWRLSRRIVRGTRRDIYMAREERDMSQKVAVKIEHDPGVVSWSAMERRVYQELSTCSRIPLVHMWGQVPEMGFHYLVMELLGRDLHDLLRHCGMKFSLKTVLMAGRDMIKCLQQVHSQGLIHGDVAPENFLMGRGSVEETVYLVGFTRSALYKDMKTGQHVEFEENWSSSQTIRYASLNCHSRFRLSRRDDLEALGYVLVFFLNGTLPWESLERGSEETRLARFAEIAEFKRSIPVEALCSGMPVEFIKYFRHCRSLGFEEDPDYDYLRALLDTAFLRGNYTRDWCYDWVLMQMNEYYLSVDEGTDRPRTNRYPDRAGASMGMPEGCRLVAGAVVQANVSHEYVETTVGPLNTGEETSIGAANVSDEKPMGAIKVCDETSIGASNTCNKTSVRDSNTTASKETCASTFNDDLDQSATGAQADMETDSPGSDPESNITNPQHQQTLFQPESKNEEEEVSEPVGASSAIPSEEDPLSLESTTSDSDQSGEFACDMVDEAAAAPQSSSSVLDPFKYDPPGDEVTGNTGGTFAGFSRMRAILNSPGFDLGNRSLLDRMSYASTYDACKYGGVILTRAWPGGVLSTIHPTLNFSGFSRDSEVDPPFEDPENGESGNHHPPDERETAKFVGEFYRRPGEDGGTTTRFRQFSHFLPLERLEAEEDQDFEKISAMFSRLRSRNDTL